MSYTVNDLYNRLHDLVKDGYGEYELLFDYDKGESFFEYDGYYVNSAVILEITEEEREEEDEGED